ncbi:MAG: radical SAM protein, partial [bacterium]
MNPLAPMETSDWIKERVRSEENDRYLDNELDFINEHEIFRHLEGNRKASKQQIKAIISKSLSIERLEPSETAALLNVTDLELWQEIFNAAGKIKKAVYDNRIVTFAPLYCGSYCVNNCLYCGFRSDNHEEKRRILTLDEIRREIEVLAGKIGHKRLVAVFGEHPLTGIDYIADV